MTDTTDNPTALDVMTLRCLQCGKETSTRSRSLVECPRCGAFDYHVFRGRISCEDASLQRRASIPDNRNVINDIIELVQRKTR